MLAAVASSAELLVAARAAQGLSAAMAQPASLALVPTLFPHEPRRGQIFAVVGVAVSLGGARLVRRLGNRLVAVASLLLGAGTLAAFAVAVLATTLATVSRSPQDPAGYTAAYLMGAPHGRRRRERMCSAALSGW